MAHIWLKDGDEWNQLGGGLDPDREGVVLKALATRVSRPGMVGFDVGCFAGWTSSQVWDIFGNNGGHFYCVDWFRGAIDGALGTDVPGSQDHPVAGQWWSPDAVAADPSKIVYPSDRVLIQLLKNIEVKGASDYVSVIVGEATETAKLVADKSLDYVYLGGDHRHTGFVRDLRAWLPKMREGGVMTGHAMDAWSVQPDSDQWKELCALPEKDFYTEVNLHFGINWGLWEVFGSQGSEVICQPNLWWVIC